MTKWKKAKSKDDPRGCFFKARLSSIGLLFLSAAKPTDQGEESVVLLVIVVVVVGGGPFSNVPCTFF